LQPEIVRCNIVPKNSDKNSDKNRDKNLRQAAFDRTRGTEGIHEVMV